MNPIRRENLIVKDLGGDAVVDDEGISEAHELNPAAALAAAISRRQFIGAAVAVLVPVVTTVVAPTPAMAQSNLPNASAAPPGEDDEDDEDDEDEGDES